MHQSITPTQQRAVEQRRSFRQRIAECAKALTGLPKPQAALAPRKSVNIEITEGGDVDTEIPVTACNGQVVFVTMKQVVEATQQFNQAMTGRLTIERIQVAVCKEFGVTRTDLCSSRRTAIIVRPRQLAMYLAKSMTLRSLPEIGRRFGGRDHTTVLHAVRKIGALVGKDAELDQQIEAIKSNLEGLA
jgi:hypothetical protein